jgi:uncharacterized protein (TIGR02246 family)
LKRRISDSVYRQLLADAEARGTVGTGQGGQMGAALSSSAAGSVPRPDPGSLETRRPADLVKRSLLDEDEDRRTITTTGTTNPLTQRGATIERMSASEGDQVLLAAEQRAAALAAGDPEALRALMHPSLQWTTFKGDVLSREQYIAGNTGGVLTWRSQRLEHARVVVVGDTAVLTALVIDEVRKDGQDQSFTLRLTQTWVRAESGWRCLAGHAGPEGA